MQFLQGETMAKKKDRYYGADMKVERGNKGEDSFAGMPMKVVLKAYPKTPYGLTGSYDDSPAGMDMQMEDNFKRINSHRMPQNKGGN
jgi:hypothetical protein